MKASSIYDNFNQSGLRNIGPIQLQRIHPFYNRTVASWTNPTNNACGAAAIATQMAYWGMVKKGMKLIEIVKNIYTSEDGKPDILNGVLGTSVERVRDYQIKNRMSAVGYNIERNRVSNVDGKFDWLRGWVDAGYPVAVIIDTGPIGTPHNAHWAVVVKMDAKRRRIEVANFIPDEIICGIKVSKRGILSLDPDTFMKAWEAHIVNIATIHFASVISHI